MFFFIGGIQPKTILIKEKISLCPYCSQMQVDLKRVDNYLSIFFIPIIRIKKGLTFLLCRNCHNEVNGSKPRTDANGFQQEKNCQYCGQTITENFFYCPYCGKTIN